MIDLKYFVIGFLVYVAFNIVTFIVYSKKKEVTNKYILMFIYIYYSILAGYVINIVDYNELAQNSFEVFVQTAIFILAGGLFMLFYYQNIIKKDDEEYIDKSISRI